MSRLLELEEEALQYGMVTSQTLGQTPIPFPPQLLPLRLFIYLFIAFCSGGVSHWLLEPDSLSLGPCSVTRQPHGLGKLPKSSVP